MAINRETLEAAASAGMLKYSQIDNLLVFLVQQELKRNRESDSGRFNLALFYYLGGLLAVGAAIAFAALAVNALGMGALLWFAVLYALCAVGVAHWCAQRELSFAASVFSVCALLLAAAAIFAMQALQGRWDGGLHSPPGIDARWLEIEIVVLAASITLLGWLRLPFLLLPSAFTLWLIGMDVVPYLVTQANALSSFGMTSIEELRKAYTLVMGLLLVVFGLYVDLRRQPVDARLPFWSYFAGLLAFCTAVPLLLSNQLPGKLVYLVVHVGLVMVGALLGRRIFEVFGALGIVLVMSDIAWDIFRGGMAVVSAMTVLCLVLLAISLWWWRREPAFAVKLRQLLPQDMQKHLGTRTA